MDPLNNLTRIAQLFQRKSAKTEPRSAPAERAGTHLPTHAPLSQVDPTALRQRLRDRLKNYNLEEPAERERAEQVFVESVLVWQFGEEVLRDADFTELAEQVRNDMLSHPQVREQLIELLRILHKSPV